MPNEHVNTKPGFAILKRSEFLDFIFAQWQTLNAKMLVSKAWKVGKNTNYVSGNDTLDRHTRMPGGIRTWQVGMQHTYILTCMYFLGDGFGNRVDSSCKQGTSTWVTETYLGPSI